MLVVWMYLASALPCADFLLPRLQSLKTFGFRFNYINFPLPPATFANQDSRISTHLEKPTSIYKLSNPNHDNASIVEWAFHMTLHSLPTEI